MTTEPETDTAAPSPEGVDVGDKPVGLSAFVEGHLTAHFAQGAVVTRRMSQSDARAFLNKQQDQEKSDRVTWETRCWFTWQGEQVVFSSFDADADQNFPVTPEDRHRLAEAGHNDGVIASLVQLWKRQDRREEPTYSVNAIAALHWMALDGADRRTWEAAARALEGLLGAQRVATSKSREQAQSSQSSRDVPPDLVDDDVEPDEATPASTMPNSGQSRPGTGTLDSAEAGNNE